VLKKNVITCALALAFATATAGAQSTSTASDQQPTSGSSTTATTPSGQSSEARSTSQAGSTTLTGCVYEEKDVPGRTPNVAEQAGVLEDYILAVDATSAAGATAGTSGTSASGAAGTMGAKAKMFKLEHADDDKLKSMVGKRVEVTGRVDAEAGDQPTGTAGAARDDSAGPDRIELPEFEVTSIRETSGSCPAKPAGQQ
jgi:hypothetical protein